MKFYPFTFVCQRDWSCFEWLVESAEALHEPRLCFFTAFFDPIEKPWKEAIAFCEQHQIKIQERLPNFAPWSEQSTIVKLDGFRQMVNRPEIKDEDYIIHIDSDCLFFSSRIFEDLGSADLVGPQHVLIPLFGERWSWTSGAFQAIKKKKAQIATSFSSEVIDRVFTSVIACDLSTVNDDVVISFIFWLASARAQSTKHAGNGNLEAILLGNEEPKSLVHYGTDQKTFLEVENCPKWQFPEVAKKKFPDFYRDVLLRLAGTSIP